jgi:hypothetical protein
VLLLESSLDVVTGVLSNAETYGRNYNGVRNE